MKKIMITGVSGFLGSNLAAAWAGRYDILGVSRSAGIDITAPESIVSFAGREKPGIIIHCAAVANVDACERSPDTAWRVYVEGTGNVVRAAREARAKLVYISTDQVFDGKKGDYSEDDEASPVNEYGRTKLAAEKVVTEGMEEHVVLRTNFYGWSIRKEMTFAEWILDAALNGKNITLFRDFIFNPLFTNDLAVIILRMLEKGLNGTFNLGSEEYCSKLEFGKKLLETFNIDFSRTDIKEGVVSDVKLAAERPRNVSLNTAKIRNSLGEEMPGIGEGLGRMKGILERGYPLVKGCFKGLSTITVKGE